tara:strand:- start:3773 stop:4021 length:249 start_codon:yes stop_codon:yes gene_type:complete
MKSKLRERIRGLIRLDEVSVTATGAGSSAFTANVGTGAQYATPHAFRKDKDAKGAEHIYYYKLGFKPVPKIKPRSYDIKKIY